MNGAMQRDDNKCKLPNGSMKNKGFNTDPLNLNTHGPCNSASSKVPSRQQPYLPCSQSRQWVAMRVHAKAPYFQWVLLVVPVWMALQASVPLFSRAVLRLR